MEAQVRARAYTRAPALACVCAWTSVPACPLSWCACIRSCLMTWQPGEEGACSRRAHVRSWEQAAEQLASRACDAPAGLCALPGAVPPPVGPGAAGHPVSSPAIGTVSILSAAPLRILPPPPVLPVVLPAPPVTPGHLPGGGPPVPGSTPHSSDSAAFPHTLLQAPTDAGRLSQIIVLLCVLSGCS